MFYPKFGGAITGRLQVTGRMGLFLAKTFVFAVTPPLKFSSFSSKFRFNRFSLSGYLHDGSLYGMVLGLQGIIP